MLNRSNQCPVSDWNLSGLKYSDDGLYREYDIFTYNPDIYVSDVYHSLYSLYMKSEIYERETAFNLPHIEFTTNEEIYLKTGIYGVYKWVGMVYFICSTDVLFYLDKVFHSIVADGYRLRNYRFMISELGRKHRVDGNNLYTIVSILNNSAICFDGITKEDVLKYFNI